MTDDPAGRLTGRDRDILDLASKGLTDKQIADELGLTRGTVISYWARIRLKLHVSSRTEAVSVIQNLALKASEESGQALQHQLQEKAEETVALRNQSLELERKVRERTSALQEANRDLEAEVIKRKQSELKFRSLYDNAEVALFTSNLDGSALIEANIMALSLFEGTRSQLVGKPTRALWADLNQRQAIVEKLLATGKISNTECVFQARSGKVKHCSVNAVLDRDSGIVEWSAIDISESARAKRIINKNLDRTRLMLDLHERSPKLNERELYHLILDIAVALTDSSVGFFHLVSEDQENIELTAWNNETLKSCSAAYDTHYPVSKAGNWVDCIKTGKPVYYNDFAKSPNQKGLPEGHFPLSRFLSVPVTEEGNVRIIFGVGNKQLPYDDNDSRQIELLAADIRPILENRKLHQDLVKSESDVRRKLDALVNPDEDLSDLGLDDLLDMQEFERLFHLFRQMTGISGGFVESKEGRFIGTNWQEVCTKFHRTNSQMCRQCLDQKRSQTSSIKPGNFKLYKCLSNLWEMATPIYYGERNFGYITFGQFLFSDEKPDLEEFARQAEAYGFNKEEYLECVSRVPVFSREYAQKALNTFGSVCKVLIGLSFSKIKIARHLHERTEMFELARLGEQRYRSVVESVSDWIFGTDANGTITYVSSKVESALGYPSDRLIGKTISYFVSPCSAKKARDEFAAVWSSRESIVEWPISLSHIEGSTREYVCNGKPIHDSHGQFTGYIGSMRDVTDRKRAELELQRSEHKFRTAFLTSPDSVNINRLSDGLYLEVNDGFANILGYSADEVLGKTSLELNIWDDPSDRSRLIDGLKRRRYVENLEARFRRKDGTIRHGLMSARIIELEGETCILSITRDITERKVLEDQKQFLSSVVEQVTESVIITNTSFEITYVNQAAQDLFGYTLQELIGQTPAIFNAEPLAADIQNNIYATISTGETYLGSALNKRKDGSLFTCEFKISPLFNRDGVCTHYIGLHRDITDRKLEEEELSENRAQLEGAMDLARMAKWEYDVRTGLFMFNDRFYELYATTAEREGGYQMPAEVYASEFLHPDDSHLVAEEIRKALATSDPYYRSEVEHRIIRRDGQIRNIVVRFTVKLDSSGNVVKTIGANQDITERKLAEQKLRESEERYQHIDSSSRDAIYSYDLQGRFTHANKSLCDLLGLSQEQIVGKTHAELGFPKAQCDEWDILHGQVFETDATVISETATPIQGGMPKHFEVVLNPIHGENGAIIGIAGTTRDITDRKVTEQKLRQTAQIAKVGGWEVDLEGNTLVWTEETYRIHELDPRESPSVAEAIRFYHIDDQPRIAAAVQKALETGEGYDIEARLITAQNNLKWVRTIGTAVRRDGHAVGIHGMIQDITDRKQAEAQLHLQSLVLNQIQDRVTVTDTDGVITYVNDAEVRSIGYTREELIGRSTVIYGEDPERGATQREIREKTLKFGEWRGEVVNYTADGQENIVDCRTQAVRDEQGELVALAGFATDITERKLVEKALRESEETHRALVEGLPDIIMRFDRDGRHLFVSDNVCDTVDIEPEDFLGKTHSELGFPEDLCRFWELSIRRVFDSGAPIETEFTLEGKAGPVIFDWRLLPERDGQGIVTSVLSVSRDITAYRKAEQEYQTLFHEMMDGFALHEIILDEAGSPADYRFLAVNPAFERLTGLKANDIVGRTVLEVLSDSELPWIEKYGQVALTGVPIHFESYSEALHRHFEVAAFRPAPMQFACLFADVTERKLATSQLLAAQQELEEKVAQRTAQLAEANSELESFSYSISHDLRAPLRTMGGFTQILKEDYINVLDDEGVHLVERIAASANHMGHLIDGLLRLSRINRSKLDIKKVSISDICFRYIESIESSAGGTNIQWVIEPGYYAECDEQLAESLVDNLLSNAVKYSSKSERPKITFGTMQIESENVMFIEDNGIGFDMSVSDRLFNAFQRFHSSEAYEGLGIGLATAKRIVNRHGGRIWAESTPGEGSRFFFTLQSQVSARK